MSEASHHEDLLRLYDEARHDLSIFMEGIMKYIGAHPQLTRHNDQAVHSFKSRLKDREHLREKITRKINDGRNITSENLFYEITDLAGVRILHLFQESFAQIDGVIRRKVASGDWILGERPKVYTWDPEVVEFFRNFDLEIVQKPTAYTSVHYLIRPRADSPICCELQVRTLFEEIWGEVDHRINYPVPTESIACAEQLKVLSKIVGAGSRLLDALNRVQKNSGSH